MGNTMRLPILFHNNNQTKHPHIMSEQTTTPTLKVLGYPCRQTMGAFLRFKRETGREATEMSGELSDMLIFIYCCTASACAADHIDFPYKTVDEFADHIDPADLTTWVNAMQQAQPTTDEATTDDQKKSHSAS